MKATTFDLSVLGERMKASREALGLTQTAFHEQFGYGSVRSYQKNEAGSNEAGIGLAGSFIKAGINANWLLTGEGPMLLADLYAAPQQAGALDEHRLRLALEAVEEGLVATRRTMEPNKKAELVMAVYDLLEEPSVTKERVLRLVKLAA